MFKGIAVAVLASTLAFAGGALTQNKYDIVNQIVSCKCEKCSCCPACKTDAKCVCEKCDCCVNCSGKKGN